MRRVLVLGGSGFVGRHLCEKAGRLQCRLTVPTRRLENAKAVQPLPWVDPVQADVHDEAQLARLLPGHDAVVNLVAILHGTQTDFARVHVELVHKLVRACRAAGVRRVVHVSALGAAAGAPSMYQRSKAAGEAALAEGALDATVLRPSVVFGAGDHFLNLFARLQALFPVLPLAGAATRLQPVWVEDLALAIVHALQAGTAGPGTAARAAPVVEACGPDVYTLRELVQLAGRLSGHPRPVFALPDALARLQAGLMEVLPGAPLMRRDNLDSLRVDNVASGTLPGLQSLGVVPAALDAIAPGYLAPRSSDALLARRRSAGRF